MFKFKFTIDKETCFVYWAQSLIKWSSWYFEKENYEFYRSLGGKLTAEENTALLNLLPILEEGGFDWLWKAYSGVPIEDKGWFDVKSALDKKFNIAWREELPRLKKWVAILEAYDFEKFESQFDKVFKFFNVSTLQKSFEVKLLLSASPKFPTAHVKDGFEKNILLNISRLDYSDLNRAIGALLHETLHKIQYKSDSKMLLREAYDSFIRPLEFDVKNYTWKYLLVESTLKSICSTRSNTYFGKILWSKVLPEDVIRDSDLPNNKTNFEYLARVVAARIEPVIEDYLDNSKPLDKFFAQKIAEEWIKIFKTFAKN